MAHLDSINDKTDNPADPAPGADDDASGCAALLVAAAGMKDVRFERTVRFVFTTGEENGILGSAAYAKKGRVPHQNRASPTGSGRGAARMTRWTPWWSG